RRDRRGGRLRVQRHGAHGSPQRHGLPGLAPPRGRRPHPFAMGAPIDRRQGTAPAAQVLQGDALRPGGPRRFPRALSACREAGRGGPAMTRAILRLASWIVPRARRADWLAEWRAELHHVARVDRAQAVGFTRGAFRDALWLRRHDPRPRPALFASPIQTLAILAALAAVGAICRPAPRIPEDVVAIRAHGRPVSLTYDQYRALAAHP